MIKNTSEKAKNITAIEGTIIRVKVWIGSLYLNIRSSPIVQLYKKSL
jgi:hypothetical protein